MQQILALQQQKQALEVRPPSPTIQPTPNIPITVIPPPNNIPHPIETQLPVQNTPTPLIIPPNILPAQPNTQPNDFPLINTSVNPPPPPVISQEFNIPPIIPNVPPPILGQPIIPANGLEQIPFNQPPPVLPTFLTGGFPDFSKPPPGFPLGLPPVPEPVEELLPSVPYYDLPAGLMIPLIKVIFVNLLVKFCSY